MTVHSWGPHVPQGRSRWTLLWATGFLPAPQKGCLASQLSTKSVVTVHTLTKVSAVAQGSLAREGNREVDLVSCRCLPLSYSPVDRGAGLEQGQPTAAWRSLSSSKINLLTRRFPLLLHAVSEDFNPCGEVWLKRRCWDFIGGGLQGFL